ncbi:MAG: hypothetical protein AAFX93_17610 [Verrucomicrobiota bacterium]
MTTRPILFAMLIALASPMANAATAGEVVTFDRFVIDPEELFFEEDKRIRPDKTFINLRNFRAMSNPNGDRFALVTVQNQLNSKLILDSEEFVGVLADGTHRYPREIDISLDAARTRTFVLDFGNSRFPLVKVIIENG